MRRHKYLTEMDVLFYIYNSHLCNFYFFILL